MYTIIILLEIFLTLALFVHSTPLEDPVIFGHNLAIRFTGVANEVIEKGAIMSFYHDQSGKVDHEADFCKDFVEQSGFACPVEGDLDLTSTMYLESSPEEPKNVSENTFIASKKHRENQINRITDTYNLLAFAQMIANATIPFIFFSPNIRRARLQLRPKTSGFWTEVFPYLSDNEGYNSFRRHFRITLTTFNTIVARLETHPRLANGTSVRVLEQTLGISQGSVIHFTDRFLEALLDLEQKKIMWPQGTRLAAVIQGFEHGITGLAHNLPNVIGAMDGLHIPIHPPSKNGARFVNRSVHDARVFYRSSLYHEISHNPEQWVPGGTYIIADSAYPLKTYLVKPFSNFDILTHRERKFNKIHSSMRMVVEQAFGLLKGRWRILLKEVNCTDLERITRIIHACCILHNICINNGDLLSSEDEIKDDNSEENDEENEDDEEIFIANEGRERIAGIQKREYLENLLMNV
ncbi:3462_t:CDS:2 [Funneliformis geosporum]|nr:3462_t:CDS:2 [Funneliformis geosporum]